MVCTVYTLPNQTNVVDPFLFTSILTLNYGDTLIPLLSFTFLSSSSFSGRKYLEYENESLFPLCMHFDTNIFWYVQIRRQHTVLYKNIALQSVCAIPQAPNCDVHCMFLQPLEIYMVIRLCESKLQFWTAPRILKLRGQKLCPMFSYQYGFCFCFELKIHRFMQTKALCNR
jgi:hypothetical protein